MCVHVCACCIHVCMHMYMGAPLANPTTIHPLTHPWGHPRISKNLIKLEWIKIFQFYLKILNLLQLLHPWFGWVGLWVKSCEITKKLIKLDLIKIVQFCLKIYDLWTYSPPMGECMDWSVSGFMSNWINCHLIQIIEFCLKIYDFWWYPHLWVGVQVGQLVGLCQISNS